MNTQLPSGTVTFLFTDIEGSTRLWQEKPEAMASSHARHNEILRQAIEANHGYVFQITGDSFSAAFHSAPDGLRAALAAQRGLQAEAWGETGALRVRMGLLTGTAENLPDGLYEGYATLAATQRVMSAAHGGQTLVAESSYGLLQPTLPEGVRLLDMGEHRLKDLRTALRLYQVEAADLPQDFPPIKSIDSQPNNLPAQLTSFIGREKEIAEIKTLVHGSRLVTLTGSGGTGKTRLSVEVGTEELGHFTDGAWFIELAPLTDPAQIMPAMAQALGLQELPSIPLATVVTNYLHDKKLLLILDNCEHLIEACARLADDLLHQCPGLKMLVSSREALGIAGEAAYHTPSLANSESTRLFVERARAANSKFSLTEANAAAIGQICSHLDGIPLAIELAAARTRVLSVDQIAKRLDDRFILLTGGSRSALPRQQTLRALIDWSYNLLGEEERRLLRRVSVFAGGWTFEAAEFIYPELEVLEILTQLVNKSLVVVEDDGGEFTRYHLLETIRQYAREKLLEAGSPFDDNQGELFEARSMHSKYFVQLAETAGPELNRAHSSRWVDILESEQENLRAAIEWTTEQEIEAALRMIYALQFFFVRNGHQAEGRTLANKVIGKAEMMPALAGEEAVQRKYWITRALSALIAVAMSQGDYQLLTEVSAKCEEYARAIGNPGLLARALGYRCAGRLTAGDIEGVEAWSQEALKWARESEDAFALGYCLGMVSEYLIISGKDFAAAREYANQSKKVFEEDGDLWGYSLILLGTGIAAKFQGNYEFARENFEISLPLFEEMEDIQRVTMIQSELAHMERYEGHLDQAEQVYRQTILVWQKIGHQAAVANQLECLAFIAMAHEKDKQAVKLLGAAEVIRAKINIPMLTFERVEYDERLAELRGGMGEKEFADLWSEGGRLTMDQAVQFALNS
jgi:predicted ATPase/class 3 adenylate cyclase